MSPSGDTGFMSQMACQLSSQSLFSCAAEDAPVSIQAKQETDGTAATTTRPSNDHSQDAVADDETATQTTVEFVQFAFHCARTSSRDCTSPYERTLHSQQKNAGLSQTNSDAASLNHPALGGTSNPVRPRDTDVFSIASINNPTTLLVKRERGGEKNNEKAGALLVRNGATTSGSSHAHRDVDGNTVASEHPLSNNVGRGQEAADEEMSFCANLKRILHAIKHSKRPYSSPPKHARASHGRASFSQTTNDAVAHPSSSAIWLDDVDERAFLSPTNTNAALIAPLITLTNAHGHADRDVGGNTVGLDAAEKETVIQTSLKVHFITLHADDKTNPPHPLAPKHGRASFSQTTNDAVAQPSSSNTIKLPFQTHEHAQHPPASPPPLSEEDTRNVDRDGGAPRTLDAAAALEPPHPDGDADSAILDNPRRGLKRAQNAIHGEGEIRIVLLYGTCMHASTILEGVGSLCVAIMFFLHTRSFALC